MNATQPTSHWITVSNLKLHVLDWGGASNPPLILLHGLASTCHMFDLIAPTLAERFHVFAPDQRGHGLSDKPDAGYDFETIAADLDALLAHINPSGVKVIVIGHSWGAYTALYYAATRADKVSSVVLLDGGLKPIGEQYMTWEEAQVKMAPPVYQNRTLADIQHLIRVDWLGDIYRPELAPLALSIYDTSNPDDVRAHLSRDNHMQIAHALWAFNPADYFPRLTCPLLVVNAVPTSGQRSPLVTLATKQAERFVDDIQVIWMNDTDHDIPWHRPQALLELLETWL
jgi:pimeloyl-ACP methyl ester carboxylesterase